VDVTNFVRTHKFGVAHKALLYILIFTKAFRNSRQQLWSHIVGFESGLLPFCTFMNTLCYLINADFKNSANYLPTIFPFTDHTISVLNRVVSCIIEMSLQLPP
jgi:F0F1-type ATP synthase assembly protein I